MERVKYDELVRRGKGIYFIKSNIKPPCVYRIEDIVNNTDELFVNSEFFLKIEPFVLEITPSEKNKSDFYILSEEEVQTLYNEFQSYQLEKLREEESLQISVGDTESWFPWRELGDVSEIPYEHILFQYKNGQEINVGCGYYKDRFFYDEITNNHIKIDYVQYWHPLPPPKL